MLMDCPFCHINPKKTRVLKNKRFVRIIFSNPRLMPGHLLIIPKRHVEKLSELHKKERQELFETVIEFQEKILSKKIAAGCDIRINYRPFQKQDNLKINHLHIHLQPRGLFDELYKKCQISEKNIFQSLSRQEADKIFKILSD